MPASVWADTADELNTRGHRAIPLELPGVDDTSRTASLDDQIDAALGAVDRADRALAVGHSAAATLAWIVADRRPDAISGVALVGGFPATSGSSYAAFFEIDDGVMAFPGWDPFEGPDSVDLDSPTRERLAEIAVPVPEAVACGIVEYGDDRRFTVPVTIVCPEFTPDDVRGWIDSGDMAGVDRIDHLDLVDIDSGHWPMVTRPAELAELLAHAAETSGSTNRDTSS